MSDPPSGPVPYEVVGSGRVRRELVDLVARARERGRGAEFVAAVREIDRRLRIYPQFGEPLLDLKHEPGQVWIGSVPPLVVRYAVYDDLRQVMVAIPLMPLPRSGPG